MSAYDLLTHGITAVLSASSGVGGAMAWLRAREHRIAESEAKKAEEHKEKAEEHKENTERHRIVVAETERDTTAIKFNLETLKSLAEEVNHLRGEVRDKQDLRDRERVDCQNAIAATLARAEAAERRAIEAESRAERCEHRAEAAEERARVAEKRADDSARRAEALHAENIDLRSARDAQRIAARFSDPPEDKES